MCLAAIAAGALMQPSEASSAANLRNSGVMQRTPADKAVSVDASSVPSQPSAGAECAIHCALIEIVPHTDLMGFMHPTKTYVLRQKLSWAVQGMFPHLNVRAHHLSQHASGCQENSGLGARVCAGICEELGADKQGVLYSGAAGDLGAEGQDPVSRGRQPAAGDAPQQ
jgi:hypothetical protein